MTKRIIEEQEDYLKNHYYMEIEIEALQRFDNPDIIKGIEEERVLNTDWVEHIKKSIDNNVRYYTTIEDYIKWVNEGGGDIWTKIIN
jgi:hypothetical protein|tara:strand:- start:295 stop:555 length:261 start_codon:yes stop_codon:yes gene_type:complete